MKILGLIPARGGSKGIPDKNKKLLNGKPLLQYTIEAALNSKLLDSVIFSSEDESLIRIAKDLGVEIPFIRPEKLASDKAGSIEVIVHAVKKLLELGEEYDAVCLLQVTTPFRTSFDIDNAINKFITEKKDALISVQKVPHQYNPHWVFKTTESNSLKIATGESNIIKRRQDLPITYIRDGAIYITKTEVILGQYSFFGKSTSFIEFDPKHHINIDTIEDWKKAEEIAKNM